MAGVVVVTRRRRRWVAAWGRLAIAVACLCAAPGPLGQVDGGMAPVVSLHLKEMR
jgi:hypothetical protein